MKTNRFFSLPSTYPPKMVQVMSASGGGKVYAVYTGDNAAALAAADVARRNAEEWQRIVSKGPHTRYEILSDSSVTIDRDEADQRIFDGNVSEEAVRVTEGVFLLDNGIRDGEFRRALWSDGRLTPALRNAPDGPFTPFARRLLCAAIFLGSPWRPDRWVGLLSVADGEFVETNHYEERHAGQGGYSNDEITLYRVDIPDYPTLYSVLWEGGALGAEGDTWHDERLFENKDVAFSYFDRLVNELTAPIRQELEQEARWPH